MAVYKFCPTHSFCEYDSVTSAIKWAVKAPKIEIVLPELNSTNKPSQQDILLVRDVPFLRKTKKNGLLTVSEDFGSTDWRSIYFSTQESMKVGFFYFKFFHKRVASNSFLFKIHV